MQSLPRRRPSSGRAIGEPIARNFADSKVRRPNPDIRAACAPRLGKAPPTGLWRGAMSLAFDAYVTAALFDADGEAVFALGDGQVRWAGGAAPDAARRRGAGGGPPSDRARA